MDSDAKEGTECSRTMGVDSGVPGAKAPPNVTKGHVIADILTGRANLILGTKTLIVWPQRNAILSYSIDFKCCI